MLFFFQMRAANSYTESRVNLFKIIFLRKSYLPTTFFLREFFFFFFVHFFREKREIYKIPTCYYIL